MPSKNFAEEKFDQKILVVNQKVIFFLFLLHNLKGLETFLVVKKSDFWMCFKSIGDVIIKFEHLAKDIINNSYKKAIVKHFNYNVENYIYFVSLVLIANWHF